MLVTDVQLEGACNLTPMSSRQPIWQSNLSILPLSFERIMLRAWPLKGVWHTSNRVGHAFSLTIVVTRKELQYRHDLVMRRAVARSNKPIGTNRRVSYDKGISHHVDGVSLHRPLLSDNERHVGVHIHRPLPPRCHNHRHVGVHIRRRLPPRCHNQRHMGLHIHRRLPPTCHIHPHTQWPRA
jgi:hypothetical protein